MLPPRSLDDFTACSTYNSLEYKSPWTPPQYADNAMWSQDIFSMPSTPSFPMSTMPMLHVPMFPTVPYQINDHSWWSLPPDPVASGGNLNYHTWNSMLSDPLVNTEILSMDHLQTSQTSPLEYIWSQLEHGTIPSPLANNVENISPNPDLETSPDPSSVSPATGRSPSLDHEYRRISTEVDHGIIDESLELCEIEGQVVFKCIWPGCSQDSFKRKCNARIHVSRRHLASSKLFECTTCFVQFSSEGTAKRHRDSRDMKFPCKFCGNAFSRKDYRNLHERNRCGMRG